MQLAEARLDEAGEARGSAQIIRLMNGAKRHIALELLATTSPSGAPGGYIQGPPWTRWPTATRLTFWGFTQPVAGFLALPQEGPAPFQQGRTGRSAASSRPGSAQPRSGADFIHLTLDEAIEIATGAGCKDLNLEARRAGIDDKNCIHRFTRRQPPPSFGGHLRKARRPQRYAMRLRTELAGDVRTIGTRAPSTRPAASAFARNVRFLASMFPASRSGTTRNWARPATGELMPFIFAASGSIALSNASGPSSTPPGRGPRSAIYTKPPRRSSTEFSA